MPDPNADEKPVNQDVKPEDEKPKDETPDGEDDDPQDAGKLKDALKKEREARRAFEKRAKALETEKATADAAKAKADEDAAAKRGEFEKLATERAERITALTDENKGIKAENERLRTAIAANVDTAWKALPKEVQEVYTGAEDDVLARYAFLPKAEALALKLNGGTTRGAGPNPRPGGPARPADDEAALAANARRYG